MIVGFNTNKLITFMLSIFIFFTIYSQSLKGLTWRKYKNRYILRLGQYQIFKLVLINNCFSEIRPSSFPLYLSVMVRAPSNSWRAKCVADGIDKSIFKWCCIGNSGGASPSTKGAPSSSSLFFFLLSLSPPSSPLPPMEFLGVGLYP